MTTHSDQERTPLSPVAFARDYQAYRQEAARIPYADTRILHAARFWSPRASALTDGSYTAFWKEDLPPLIATLPQTAWDDLEPDELTHIAAFLDTLPARLSPQSPSRAVWEEAARKWLYLGEVRQTLEALVKGLKVAPLDEKATTAVITEINHLDAEDIPNALATALESSHPDLARWLRSFDANRQMIRESGYTSRAQCLLVEYDHTGKPARGRLRTLEGNLEQLKPGADADEVVFHHQIRSPNDPHVTSVYAALGALRHTLTRRTSQSPSPQCHSEERSDEESAFPPRGDQKQILPPASSSGGLGRQDDRGGASAVHRRSRNGIGEAKGKAKGKGPHFRAQLAFTERGEETFGGESIGLAAFAVAYGNHWGSELHRERKLIGHSVAFTGAMRPDGTVDAISADSLTAKVARAFCSPLEYLVVPEANRRTAEAAVESLRQQHPRRRLRIIGVERASDLLTDHNILRPEKVCVGEFAVRAAARYTRSVKVQVPVLLLLLYALVCIIEPRAWVGFDRNPAFVLVSEGGFMACNADSTSLWEVTYECPGIDPRSTWTVGNLDGDSRNEIAFCPRALESENCEKSGRTFVYDDDGELLFERALVLNKQGCPDYFGGQGYIPGKVRIVELQPKTIVVTTAHKSFPARTHIRLWDEHGNDVGWYVNAGYSGPPSRSITYKDTSGLYFSGYNSLTDCACVFVLPIDSCRGVSPPIQAVETDLPSSLRGNQVGYVLFSRTDLNRAALQVYHEPRGLRVEGNGLLSFKIAEVKSPDCELYYYLDKDCRVTDIHIGDQFRLERQKYIDLGLLPAVPWDRYRKSLLDSVRYWSGSDWVVQSDL